MNDAGNAISAKTRLVAGLLGGFATLVLVVIATATVCYIFDIKERAFVPYVLWGMATFGAVVSAAFPRQSIAVALFCLQFLQP
jgi:hypothetical protein